MKVLDFKAWPMVTVESKVRNLLDGLPEFARAFRLRLADRRFWVIQGMVFAVTLGHALFEVLEHSSGFDLGPVYFVPASLYFFPVVYASLNFGREGAIPTAAWSVLLAIPNILLLHNGSERFGETFQMSAMLLLAVLIAGRVDKEIQARRRAEMEEKARRLSELKYRGLFESAGEAVLVIDREGTIVEHNTAAAELLRRPKDSLHGVNCKSILPSPVVSALLTPKDSQPSVLSDVRLQTTQGDEDVWVEPVSTPLPGEDGAVQVVLRNVTDQKRRQMDLEAYAGKILRAQEEERERIAKEVHDDTVQSLVLLCRRLDHVEEEARSLPSVILTGVKSARDSAESIVSSLRGLIRGLRPPTLDELGLSPALRKLVTDTSSRSDISGTLKVHGSNERLQPDVELALFRITQEALHNIERHSNANTFEVTVRFNADRTTLQISDNGDGFSVPAVLNDLPRQNKLGLMGMQERARILNGMLRIESAPGSGTLIIAEIPLRQP